MQNLRTTTQETWPRRGSSGVLSGQMISASPLKTALRLLGGWTCQWTPHPPLLVLEFGRQIRYAYGAVKRDEVIKAQFVHCQICEGGRSRPASIFEWQNFLKCIECTTWISILVRFMKLRNESRCRKVSYEIFSVLHASCFKWIEVMHPVASIWYQWND